MEFKVFPSKILPKYINTMKIWQKYIRNSFLIVLIYFCHIFNWFWKEILQIHQKQPTNICLLPHCQFCLPPINTDIHVKLGLVGEHKLYSWTSLKMTNNFGTQTHEINDSGGNSKKWIFNPSRRKMKTAWAKVFYLRYQHSCFHLSPICSHWFR